MRALLVKCGSHRPVHAILFITSHRRLAYSGMALLLVVTTLATTQIAVQNHSHLRENLCHQHVHGFRIAVRRMTWEIRILQSVHATDAGTILNPMQCRGQIEGAVAQGIGSELFERMVFDEHGKMINSSFHNYRIFAQLPQAKS